MSTRQQLDQAKLDGAVRGLRGALRIHQDVDLELRHRAELPALWERLGEQTTIYY